MANRTYHPRGLLVDGYRAERHPLYYTWANMLARCYNPDTPNYENYGGRGIEVCSRWHHFANFAADMGLKPDPKLTLERCDNSGVYEPGNCAWATRTEQCLNRRTFKNNTSGYRGVTKIKDRFLAQFDYEKVRYEIGRFDSAETAAAARDAFVGLFFADRPAAIAMVQEETTWCTSSTGVRGITPHNDGGYVVRVTKDGKRLYVGYFKNFDAAVTARKEALK